MEKTIQHHTNVMESMDIDSLDEYLAEVAKVQNIQYGPFAVIYANGTKILKGKLGIA